MIFYEKKFGHFPMFPICQSKNTDEESLYFSLDDMQYICVEYKMIFLLLSNLS